MGKIDEILNRSGGKIRESASHRGKPAAMPGLGGPMAVSSARDAGVVRSKVAQVIPVDRIVRDPSQPREEFDEEALGRLADSLKSQGVLQPIAVRWDEGQGAYVVVVGERRWRAAQRAGLASIPCTVVEKEFTPDELLGVQCMENLLREDLKPIEQAKAFRTLMDVHGWSANRLSKELGVTAGHVSQALALLRLPEPVQEIVDAGELSAYNAYTIASKVEDPAAQQEVAERAVAEGLTRTQILDVAEVVRKAAPRVAKAEGRGGRPADSRPAPLVFDDPDCTITVKWKRTPIRPLPRIAGDFSRWVKLQGGMDPKASGSVGKDDAGQGGEANADADAA